MNEDNPVMRHYFVDEAGDGTLFSRRGQVIVDTEGCSRFFILGLLDVSDPQLLQDRMADLRAELLADPYFKGVPSMRLEEGKTAVAFHAKDDLPEVRREVFSLLRSTPGLRFFAVVADKLRVLEYVRQRNFRQPSYRYHPNELYDYLVRRLFRDRLHKDAGYNVYFALRGKSDRTAALRQALEQARFNFQRKKGIHSNTPITLQAGRPAQFAGLQAVDYFLWALQRLYERGEERYVIYLWSAFRLVHDIDDTRQASYGAYYTQKKPLTAASIENRGKK